MRRLLRLDQAWEIAIFSVVCGAIIALVSTLAVIYWPTNGEKLPDTYVYAFGQEHSFTIEQLKEQAPIRSKITLVPIKFPKGITTVSENEVPIKFSNWTYSEGTKLYTITAHNKGEGIEKRQN